MNKTKKIVISVSSAVIALVIIFYLATIVNKHNLRDQLPALPNFATLSAPVRQQLVLANKKAENKPTADNLGMLGMAYHSSALYDQAKQCYQLAIRKDKSKWIWSYYLGYLSQEMGDSKAAIENFNTVVKENPEVIQAWYYLGEAYQNLGSGDLAEAAFKKIAFVQNDNSNEHSIRVNYSSFPISAKFELARMYLASNRLDEAEKILTEIVKGNHTIGPVYRLLGNVYSAKGDSVLSKKYLVRAQDLAEVTTLNDTLTDRLALMSRSEMYLPKQIEDAMKSANPEWAQKLFSHALLYIPNNKYIISKAIKFYLRMNSGKKALPFLDKNLTNFSDNYIEMRDVADLLSNKGFYSESIPYYEQAHKLKPEATEPIENYAMSCWRANEKEKAFNLINDLFEKNKNSENVLASIIDFMLRTNNKEKAKIYLAKFRQIAPSNPKALKMSGILNDMEGNQAASIPLFEASFKGDPGDLETAQKLGIYYIEHRMWSPAIHLLRSSMKYHPNESVVLEKLGTLLISCPDPKLQNIPEGLELSERAFFHIASTITTLIAAGKDLAIGNAMIGDFKTAKYYISVIIRIAKGEKVPQEYLDGLLKLESGIKQLNAK